MSSPLGAVAVQHVGLQLASEPRDFAGGPPIAEAELPRHGNAGDAQHAIVGEATERNRIALGLRIANDADLGPELCLPQRQIVDVAEQTSDRRAQAMQNT
jgi:hypothetical protein